MKAFRSGYCLGRRIPRRFVTNIRTVRQLRSKRSLPDFFSQAPPCCQICIKRKIRQREHDARRAVSLLGASYITYPYE